MTMTTNQRPVYLAGPSAVGKTTILDKISKTHSNVNVSLVTYASLYQYRLNHEKAAEDLLQRTDGDVFEHSIACPTLYENIHVDCKRFLFQYKNIKSLKTINDAHYKSVSFDLAMNYHTYYRKLVERFAGASDEVMEKLQNTIILLDFTNNFYNRYYARLIKDYNGIDGSHDIYLYMQVIAYFALGNFLVNTFKNYDNIYIIIDKSFDNLCLFNGRDFDIFVNIPERVNFVNGKLNDSFVREMSKTVVEFLK